MQDIYVICTEEYVVNHQRKKARKFKEALDQFDYAKARTARMVKLGHMTEDERDEFLSDLAEKLDL